MVLKFLYSADVGGTSMRHLNEEKLRPALGKR